MLGNVIDLSKLKYKDKLPFTFGVNDFEHDQVLTNKSDMNSCQTLDYIWEIIPNYSLSLFDNKDYAAQLPNDIISNPIIKVDYDSFKVEEFLIKNRPYQQLSDHFGLSCVLNNF